MSPIFLGLRNSHKIRFLYLVISESCAVLSLILERFVTPGRNARTHQLLLPTPPIPWEPLTSISPRICLFWTFRVSGLGVCSLLCLASLSSMFSRLYTGYHVLAFHSHVMLQNIDCRRSGSFLCIWISGCPGLCWRLSFTTVNFLGTLTKHQWSIKDCQFYFVDLQVHSYSNTP